MEIKQKENIHYLEASILAPYKKISHGFTTRHKGISRAPYNSLNLGINTDDSLQNVQGNRNLLARAFKTKTEKLVTVNQVHGADILVIDEPNKDFSHFQKIDCDGIITNQPNVMIAVCVADCAPILLFDPVKSVIASIHAGWKGTAAGIATKGVKSMSKIFGSNPDEIIAVIGPTIGPCCYEVDEIVKTSFVKNGLDWEACAKNINNEKWSLDISKANKDQLLSVGLKGKNIEVADQCVSCLHDRFFSYRRNSGNTGRQAGFIMLN